MLPLATWRPRYRARDTRALSRASSASSSRSSLCTTSKSSVHLSSWRQYLSSLASTCTSCRLAGVLCREGGTPISSKDSPVWLSSASPAKSAHGALAFPFPFEGGSFAGRRRCHDRFYPRRSDQKTLAKISLSGSVTSRLATVATARASIQLPSGHMCTCPCASPLPAASALALYQDSAH